MSDTIATVLFEPTESDLKFLPEGPFDLGGGRFSWVAIQHGASARYGSLNIFDMNTHTNQSYRLPGRPGFARPTENPSQFLVGAERELGLFDIQTGQWSPMCTGIDADVENTIINDATTWQDNVIFGCKDLEFKTKKAGLYLFRGRDRKLIQLRNDQICSNGKAVIEQPDGRLELLDIDTPTRKITRYSLDIAAGKLSEGQTAIDLSRAIGFPDGMTLTPNGQSAIVSFYNPDEAEFGLTQQYSLATGILEHSWRTPASPQNTCPLLMPMPDGSVKLVITTAIEHMAAERQARAPKSGCLFIADTTL
ncbi:MAG: SMP-30/gluconolactonase/LRE family protein [Pirellulaceae bacterium]|nr:SMP-30/gluconolactonase/LRE family protein [Pirellulaceae bacterium]